MRNCWSELGLDEATTDNVIIKRAYARLLKQARPDDDPEGYQRLREAYDAALEQARWMRHHQALLAAEAAEEAQPGAAAGEANAARVATLAEGGGAQRIAGEQAEAAPRAEGSPPPQEGPQPLSAATSDLPPQAGMPGEAPAEADEPMPGWFPPEQLVESLLTHWRTEGDQALSGAWPVLVGHLDELPYALRGEASVRFADLVLEHADLPYDFAHALADYFGWLQDFRAEALLGLPRAHALRRHLEHARSVAEEDPVFAQRLQRLQRFRRLRRERGAWRAWLFASLHLPSLRMLLPGLTPRMRGSLGIDKEDHADLLSMVEKLNFLRLLPFAILLAYAFPSDWKQSPDMPTVLGVALMTVVMLLVLIAGTALLCKVGLMLQEAVVTLGDMSPEAGYRFTQFFSLGGPVLCGGALLMPELAQLPANSYGGAYGLAYVLLFFASISACWFAGSAAPTVVLCWGLAIAGAIAIKLQPEPTHASLVLSCTLFWINLTLFLMHRYPQHMEIWALDPWRVIRPSSPGGWLLFVIAIKLYGALMLVLLVALLPATAVTTGRNFGTGFVVAALALAVALGLITGTKPLLYSLWFIGTLHGMRFIQGRADVLAERLYTGRWRMAEA